MTNASNASDQPTITPAEALTELFGPDAVRELPARKPGRAQKIAAIHALAEWFATHPEAPMPTVLSGLYYADPHDEPNDQVRYQDYQAVRGALDGRSYPADNVGRLDRNFQFDVCPLHVGDMLVEYRVAYVMNRGNL